MPMQRPFQRCCHSLWSLDLGCR